KVAAGGFLRGSDRRARRLPAVHDDAGAEADQLYRSVHQRRRDRARHTVAKNAYRLRERDETDNRIKDHKRQEVNYAPTRDEQRRWRGAGVKMIIAALDRAEGRVRQVINAERDVLADLARALPPEDETGGAE